ncbi:MAG: AAA family ATPase [Candidatus Bathyarchaeia archaeon]|jgi:septum site-determining protein MinD
MTAKAISIHSSRGGTGKTIIATNLALILAAKGFNVALLDLDFRAPSLATVFSGAIETPINCWLNDFLDGKCAAEQILTDVSGKYNLKGRLLIGLANPAMGAIRSTMEKSRAWEVTAVKKLFSLLSVLSNDLKIDFCISDTSPGVQYSSINAIVSSDISVIITTLDSLDLKGTEDMLVEVYGALDKKTVVLVNKYSPETQLRSSGAKEILANKIERILNAPVIGFIPCYCDVLQTERTRLLALENPNHPFVKNLEKVAEKLEHDILT